MSFCTLVLHSKTALPKSSETRRLFGRDSEGGTALEESGEVCGRITVALLNFEAEKRVHILLIASCGGRLFFFFFFEFDLWLGGYGAGLGTVRRLLSSSLEVYSRRSLMIAED